MRVVFDTTTVVSALLFPKGKLAWLREHWRAGECVSLLSAYTASELTRVLAYPKFHLAEEMARELLADYVPYCELVTKIKRCPQVCRDKKDQPFLDLAHSAAADVLVSGDDDLKALAGRTKFRIDSPEAYRSKVSELLS